MLAGTGTKRAGCVTDLLFPDVDSHFLFAGMNFEVEELPKSMLATIPYPATLYSPCHVLTIITCRRIGIKHSAMMEMLD